MDSLLRNLRTPVATLNLDLFEIIHYNKSFERWFPEDSARIKLLDALKTCSRKWSKYTVEKPYKVQIEATGKRGRPFEAEVSAWLKVEDNGTENLILEATDYRQVAETRALLASFSRIVEESNRALAHQKQSMANILNNMHQAVFAVDEALAVVDPVSKHAQEVFGVETITGCNITELLYTSLPEDHRAKVESIFRVLVGADELQWLLTIDELPRSVTRQTNTHSQTIRLSYSPIWTGSEPQTVDQILLVAEDVTELEDARAQAEHEREEKLLLFSTAEALIQADPAIVANFFLDAYSLLEAVRPPDAEPVERLRALHTLKGNARFLGLNQLVDTCHDAESKCDQPQLFKPALAQVTQALQSVEEVARRFFNPRATTADDNRSLTEIHDALAKAVHMGDTNALYAEVKRLLYRPLHEAWYGLASTLENIAHEQDKELKLKLGNCSERFDQTTVSRIRAAITHLLRNALDHGIESREARIAEGKSPLATISVDALVDEAHITIKITDDGCGIDANKIRIRANNLGWQYTEDELIDLIFRPGFSTREVVNEFSGRGVGLDVVKEEITQLGGSVSVETQLGQGTTFRLILNRTQLEDNRMSVEKDIAI